MTAPIRMAAGLAALALTGSTPAYAANPDQLPAQSARIGPQGCFDAPRVAVITAPDRTAYRACIIGEDGQFFYLITSIADPGIILARRMIDTATALSILSDRRLQNLWPDADRLLGSDHRALADAEVERTSGAGGPRITRAARDALETLNDGATRAILDRAAALNRAGRTDRALAILEHRRSLLLAPSRTSINSDAQFDAISIVLRLAQFQYLSGQFNAALATLAAAEADDRITPSFRLNPATNRAAMLAELGRSADALALIDRVIAAWELESPPEERISGSRRQFGWIRGCALQHLGRTDEAQMEFDAVRAAPEAPASIWGRATPATSGIAFRAAICAGDAEWLADLIEAGADFYPHASALSLQPGSSFANPRMAATLAAGRALVVARGHATNIRILPDDYTPALNNFRSSIAPVTVSAAP